LLAFGGTPPLSARRRSISSKTPVKHARSSDLRPWRRRRGGRRQGPWRRRPDAKKCVWGKHEVLGLRGPLAFNLREIYGGDRRVTGDGTIVFCRPEIIEFDRIKMPPTSGGVACPLPR